MKTKDEKFWKSCENCQHEMCKYCNQCHNPVCEEMDKPLKVCYDRLFKD